MSDPAAAYAVLRTETAAMLKLNAADLSLVEGLQLDLVSLVRLEVDSLQGRALANEPIDLDRLSTALGMLQKLLPAQALVSTPPPSETTRFSFERQRKLRDLIERTVFAENPDVALREADSQRREEACMADEAAGTSPEAAPAPPTASPVRSNEAVATGTAPVLPGAVVSIAAWARR